MSDLRGAALEFIVFLGIVAVILAASILYGQ